MNKFLLSTPGRTASTSLFNQIEASLKQTSTDVTAIDRGLYSDSEWAGFNASEYAAFTTFNPFNFPDILKRIDPSEWCLIVLSRLNQADWLLSMNASLSTNNYHPGKEHQEQSLTFDEDSFKSSYWYYQCWRNRVYNPAIGFGFHKVVHLDFDGMVADWAGAGRRINNWEWNDNPELMKFGMTATWNSVTNLEQVLTWIPDERIVDSIKSSL